MAHAHVPKFGNWDGENVPYTAYFDNALKEKGTKKINPNDPEENPEAFKGVMTGYETGGNHQEIQPLASQFSTSDDRTKGQKASHQKINLTQERSRNSKSNKSPSSSDKSSSDRSFLQANHNNVKRSSQRKNQGEGGNDFRTPSPPPQPKNIGIERVAEIQHQRAASVPKFGAWDETDPTSGEGFTIIFNKVKQEKRIGASRPSQGHLAGNIYSNGQRNHGSSSSIAKRCCCLFSRSDK